MRPKLSSGGHLGLGYVLDQVGRQFGPHLDVNCNLIAHNILRNGPNDGDWGNLVI